MTIGGPGIRVRYGNMALYYEPKSIAPILQESARVQVPLLSQPSGLSQALPALGGLAEKGFQIAGDREKKRMSLELAKRDYDNFLRLSPEEQSLPGNYEHGANAAMALGLPRPIQHGGLSEELKRSQIEENKATAWARKNPKVPKPDVDKAPPGYRFLPNGNLVAIPGGPAQLKNDALSATATSAQDSALEQAQAQIVKVDQALKNVSGWSTGWGGATIGKLPGSQAKNLQGDLDTIKANLGFSTLAEMKRASPTGGALGAISESEMRLLTSARESLDREQSQEQLVRNLKAVKTHYEKWADAVMKSRSGQGSGPEKIQAAGGGKSDPLGLFK
mgnify:CR=1 FL=1